MLEQGADLMVACPGRLQDFLSREVAVLWPLSILPLPLSRERERDTGEERRERERENTRHLFAAAKPIRRYGTWFLLLMEFDSNCISLQV